MEAIANAELGYWEKALELYLKAAQMSPNNIQMVSGCLALCAQQDRLIEGQKLLENIIGRDKDAHHVKYWKEEELKELTNSNFNVLNGAT